MTSTRCTPSSKTRINALDQGGSPCPIRSPYPNRPSPCCGSASNLSDAARELLRRRLAGGREVTDANRPLYRELVAARIMYPVSTWVNGPESVFRFTRAGWERREEWINAAADARHP